MSETQLLPLRSKPPTIRTIAEIVGVTPTTVSLALRDNPRISHKMRNVIQHTADEIGYRPNAELSRVMMRLKTQQRGECRPRVALVFDEKRPVEVVACIREALLPIAEKAGYAVDVIRISRPQTTFARLTDILRTRNIRGGILYQLDGSAPLQEGWMESVALCCIGPAPEGSKLPAVMWADDPVGTKQEAPLLQTAMDMLDLHLKRNRFGRPAHGIRCMLS